MDVWFYRGYRIESTPFGSDILAKDATGGWEYIEVKMALGGEKKLIDSWLYAK